jgi:hypothetical protein
MSRSFLNGVEGVSRRQPFGSGDPGEGMGVKAGEIRDPADKSGKTLGTSGGHQESILCGRI